MFCNAVVVEFSWAILIVVMFFCQIDPRMRLLLTHFEVNSFGKLIPMSTCKRPT
jgi:hypothetical protein